LLPHLKSLRRIAMPPTTGIIALVPDRWDDICMPRHQVMRRLAAHFPVVWIEPTAHWREFLRPAGSHFMERDHWCSPVPGLEVLSPGFRHPTFVRPGWRRTAAMRSRLATARQRLIDRGAQRIVLYLWRDEFEDALDLVPHDLNCYHIDDEYTFSEVEVPIPARETRVLKRVDQVIVHSEALLAKKGGINPHTVHIPNGVDFRAFSTPCGEPADLAAVPHPRIGYVGVIKKQLDLDLLVRLARARPGYSFVLVGPIMNVAGKEQQVAALRSLPNVFMLGYKSTATLPAYVQHLDVCLMCYEVNAYTKYIYPLKLHEYMAAGQPVVSAQIDAVLAYKGLVNLAGTDIEWLQDIDTSLGPMGRLPEIVLARKKAAQQHDWENLIDRIATQLRGDLNRLESGVQGRARA
jgi:glycosyltransferase involved in cell wall biosynthesis